MKLQETMQKLKAVRDEASALKARAASENRDMTAAENSAYNAKAGRALSLEEDIREVQGKNTLVKAIGGDFAKLLSGGGAALEGQRQQQLLSMDYRAAFTEYVSSN